MRAILILAVLVCLPGFGSHEAAALPAAPATLTWTGSGGPEGRHLTLVDESAEPFARPMLRLVALPPGAGEPEVRLRGDTAGQPAEVVAQPPMIMRGLRVLPLIIRPRPDGDGAGAGAAADNDGAAMGRTLEFDLVYRERTAIRGATTALEQSRGFFVPVIDYFPEEDRAALRSTDDEGGYLIITAPEMASAVTPLAAWKREMGFEVSVVSTDVTGISGDGIRAYIQNVYSTAARPPQYVLLVGDIEQIPSFDYHQNVSDLPYSLVDGDDFLPDLELGRLSARTLADAETIVAKILRHERDPYQDDPGWFSRCLLVAANYSSSTPVPVSRWCREQLLDIGYAEVDSVFYPPHWSTGPPLIKASIDRGVSLVSYRGWAYGWRGWEPPQFTVDHIPGLDNGWMLPAVFSFVCLNNDFAEPECFGEAWIRAGTPDEPKGAVAFIGNSEHWSHTRFNDAAAIGAFKAIHDQGERRLGGILNAAKFGVMEQFGEHMTYADYEDESVEFYFHIYGLLGDPGMTLWTAAPRPVNVTHAATIPQGSTVLEVEVHEADGLTPVPGARVGVSQGGAVLGCTRTDADGRALVLAPFEGLGTPVQITVTGGGLAPYQRGVDVMAGGPYLALETVQVRDDGSGASRGNGDGVANPGEILELDLQLENRGTAPATGVSSTLEAMRGATVQQGSVGFPDIAAGATVSALAPCVVELAANVEDQQRAQFRLTSSAGGDVSVAGFELAVQAPALVHHAAVLGGNGVLAPGGSAPLTVTLRNFGSVDATGVQAVLRSATPELGTVVDSLATFGTIAVRGAASSEPPFTIAAQSEAAVGQAMVLTLTLTTDAGVVGQTSFSVVIGAVDHRAPLGPDAHGYYAYDSSDTDYPDAVPVYEWITCSTAYGGAGTSLELRDNKTTVVELPFDFVYYGRSYDRLLVSDNGWASFDTTACYDFYNWSMPNSYGNGGQMAPFWDNLDPTKEHEGEPVGDGIYVLDDLAGGRFVVEWSRLGNLRSQHENHHDYDDLQTFELILYDPVRHPTPTGDGRIRFQYKQVVNNDSERMYATVGIENEAEDDGIEYTYLAAYPDGAAPLSAGLAIEFTTTRPRYSPFRLDGFSARPAPSGVQIEWEPCDERQTGGYRVYRAAAGSDDFAAVTIGALAPHARAFLDAGADPAASYRYELRVADTAGRDMRLGPFSYPDDMAAGAVPQRLALAVIGPNPLRGAGTLTYALPGKAATRLAVFSVTGRLVRILVRGEIDAGIWTARWDGRDQHGAELPSGIYFGRLEAGGERRTVKMTLLR